MTTPVDNITFGDINVECCRVATAQIDMNDQEFRELAGYPANTFVNFSYSINDVRGKRFNLTPGAGSYVSPLTTVAAGTAESGFNFGYSVIGAFNITRQGTDEGSTGILDLEIAVPLACTVVYSTRIVYVSGDSSMRFYGPAFDAWVPVNKSGPPSQIASWGFFARALSGGSPSNLTLTFTLEMARTSDLSNILSSATYTVSASADSVPLRTGGTTLASGGCFIPESEDYCIATTPSASVGTITGGTPGYTFLWEKVSGYDFQVNSPTSSSTTFTADVTTGQPSRSAVYRCRVTDSLGRIVYGPNCDVVVDRF